MRRTTMNHSAISTFCKNAPWFAFAPWLFLLPMQCPAAALTVSPSSLANTSEEEIVLNVTGLSAGAAVWVEKHLDLNRNGAMDGTDPLLARFRVEDGQRPLIGGQRNWNVPGDEDGAVDGQLKVVLHFPGLDEVLGRMAGDYLFRVADAAGGSTDLTNSLAVVQPVQPQGVTGRVLDAATGEPMPHTMVVLVSGDERHRRRIHLRGLQPGLARGEGRCPDLWGHH